MRKYRKNMKVGKPNEYKEFREREAHRLREFRKNLSAEKRRKYQDGTNEKETGSTVKKINPPIPVASRGHFQFDDDIVENEA